MLPLRMTYSCATGVDRWSNAVEQRYVTRAPMVTIEATYTNLTQADVDLVDGFFASQKGMFDSTWTIAFDSRTFTSMRFDSDRLAWEETLPNRWTTRISMTGFAPLPSSPPSSVPTLTSGAVTQRPWTRRREFDTNVQDVPSGRRFATALRGGGLTNFRTEALRGWDLQFRAIRQSDLDLLVAFWLSKRGRFAEFDFQDPDTFVTYSNCRFAADTLDVGYNGYNNCSTSFQIDHYTT